MRCLRVLSLRGCNIIDMPDSIGNLKHLRYLNLSYTSIEKLPESICYLCNLQTMILTGCSNLIELPSRMEKLINLYCLNVSGCSSLMEMPSHGIGQLKSLHWLTCFTVGQKSGSGIGELRELSEIRGTFEISNIRNVVNVNDALRANMKEKNYLDELILDWDFNWSTNIGITQQDATTDDMILNKLQPHLNLKELWIRNYPGVTFPNWLGDPSVLNLVSLQLWFCGNCSTLPPLGQLTHLKYLQILEMKGVECVGSEFYGNASFPSLQSLSFINMLNWETWLYCESRRGEFPRLQKLYMITCPKLTGKLPEQLLSLEKLEINECPQLLMASLTVPVIRELKMVDFGKLQLQMPACDFTALHTSEIGISDVSQWKQFPMAPHKLSIRKCECDSAESLLEEEIWQTNIRDLEIRDCSFSRSMHKVGLPTTLKSVSISKCSKLEFLLPELFRCHLPVLESLRIDGGVIDDSLSLSFSLGIFRKLTDFRIFDLKGLESLSISISEGDPTSLCSLDIRNCPNLVHIKLSALNLMYCGISGCSKLKLLAHTGSCVQKLSLRECPELLFQREGLPSNLRELEIWGCNQFTSQMDWDLQGLTSLTKFTIQGGCEGVELFPKDCLLPSSLTCLSISNLPNLKSLDSGGLQQLSSLLELEITECPKLQSSTGPFLQQLISLKRLQICGDCPRLQSLTEVGLEQLSSLEILNISNCWELQCLTKVGLQHLSSLEILYINYCPKLQYLTKQDSLGLQHLTSLQKLHIRYCDKLKYLTKERLPDSLCYLEVEDCPSVEKRCQFKKGKEWRYISHIPKIVINGVLL